MRAPPLQAAYRRWCAEEQAAGRSGDTASWLTLMAANPERYATLMGECQRHAEETRPARRERSMEKMRQSELERRARYLAATPFIPCDIAPFLRRTLRTIRPARSTRTARPAARRAVRVSRGSRAPDPSSGSPSPCLASLEHLEAALLAEADRHEPADLPWWEIFDAVAIAAANARLDRGVS